MNEIQNVGGFIYNTPPRSRIAPQDDLEDPLKSSAVSSEAFSRVDSSKIPATSIDVVASSSSTRIDGYNGSDDHEDSEGVEQKHPLVPLVYLFTDADKEGFQSLSFSITENAHSRKRSRQNLTNYYQPIVDFHSMLKPKTQMVEASDNCDELSNTTTIIERAKQVNKLVDESIAPINSTLFQPINENLPDIKKLKASAYAYVGCLRQFVITSLRNEETLASQSREFYRSVARIASGQVNQMGLINAITYYEEFARFVILHDYEKKIGTDTIINKSLEVQEADLDHTQFMVDDVCINRALTRKERRQLAQEKHVFANSSSSPQHSGDNRVVILLSLEEALKYFDKNVMGFCFPHFHSTIKSNLIRPVSRAINTAIEIMLENFSMEALLYQESDYSQLPAGGNVAKVCAFYESAYDSDMIDALSKLAVHVDLIKADKRAPLARTLRKIKAGKKKASKDEFFHNYVFRILQANFPENPLIKELIRERQQLDNVERETKTDANNNSNSNGNYFDEEAPMNSLRASNRIANCVTPATQPRAKTVTSTSVTSCNKRKTKVSSSPGNHNDKAKKAAISNCHSTNTLICKNAHDNNSSTNAASALRRINGQKRSTVKFASVNPYSSAERHPIKDSVDTNNKYFLFAESGVVLTREICYKEILLGDSNQGGEITVTSKPFTRSFALKQVSKEVRESFPFIRHPELDLLDEEDRPPTGSFYDLPVTPWREAFFGREAPACLQSVSNQFIGDIIHATRTFAEESHDARNGGGDEQIMFLHSVREYLLSHVKDLEVAIEFRRNAIAEKRGNDSLTQILPGSTETGKYTRVYKRMCVFSDRQLFEFYRSIWTNSEHIQADCYEQMNHKQRGVAIPYIPKLEYCICPWYLQKYYAVFDNTFRSLQAMLQKTLVIHGCPPIERLFDQQIVFAYLPSIEQHGNSEHPAAVSEPHCYFYHHNKLDRQRHLGVLSNAMQFEDPRQPLTVYVALTSMEVLIYDYFNEDSSKQNVAVDVPVREKTPTYEVCRLSRGDVLLVKGHQPHSVGCGSTSRETSYFIVQFLASDWEEDLRNMYQRRRPFWFGKIIPPSEEFALVYGRRADEYYEDWEDSESVVSQV